MNPLHLPVKFRPFHGFGRGVPFMAAVLLLGCVSGVSLWAETVLPTSKEGLRWDVYPNLPGAALSGLTGNAAFPDQPALANQLWLGGFNCPGLSASAVLAQGNYGDRLSGYLIAPKSGNYVFWVGGKDATALYLSPTTDPAGKVKIAWTDVANETDGVSQLPVWLSNGTSSGRSAANSFLFNGGAPGVINLVAGKLYYIELQHKDGPSGPGVHAVGWTKPGDGANGGGPTEVIPQTYLSPNVLAVPNLQLTNDQLASRFLNQATFGATSADIASLSAALTSNPNTAFSDWINAQFAKPVTQDDLSLPIFRTAFPPNYPVSGYRQHTHDAEAVRASLMISDNTHELRRKVAYALSQIFVVSDQDDDLIGAPEGMCDWNDLLFQDAFTTFPTLLTDVTYHPVMADFLSLQNNAKAGFYNAGSRPDENYAREVMQLFTIGLVQLRMDGSYVTDDNGHAIPTYNQSTITEVARVFTGLRFPQGMAEGRDKDKTKFKLWVLRPGSLRYGKDIVDEKRHDTGEKSFLGHTLPAGQNTTQDIGDTLAILCTHPNTAPFFAKALIQHLVTSNPSPGYVQRVAESFVHSQGDMKTVVSAVLLDDEARDPAYALGDQYGKLREPWLRVTQLARAFNAQPAAKQPFFPVYTKNLLPKLGQFPLAAPSVFNFYLPSYQSPGVVSERNAQASDSSTLVVAPEFQIMNSNTSLLTPNYFLDTLNAKTPVEKPNAPLALDLSPQIKLAANTKDLVDNVDTLLTSGMMSDRTRDIVSTAVDALGPVTDPGVLEERTKTAVYLTLLSPDYAIQK